MIGLRILTASAILTATVASLTACHGAGTRHAFQVPEQFDETKPVEITFWAKNDTNKVQVGIYEQSIRDFEKIYPSITVNLRLYSDYGSIYNDVITNISTNTTPNVCITYPDHIATYMTGENVVLPLTDIAADPRYGLGGSEVKYDSVREDEIVPQFLQECYIGDTLYALPYMRSTEACYVNKTYVEAMGYELPEVLTWDFIFEVSEKAMEKDAEGNFKVNGQTVMIPFIYKSTDNMMIQYLKQVGAPYSTADGQILIFQDQTKNFLYEVGHHAGTGAFSTFKISSYPGNFFNAGECLFAVDSTAGATWMGTHAPLSDIHQDRIVDFETVVYPVPQADPEHPQMISQGPSICIFNKSDDNEVLASWLFAQFLLTNDVQIAYSQTEGYVPVTLRAHKSEEYQDYLSKRGSEEDHSLYYSVKIDAAELLLNNLDHTFVTPVFNGSASLRDAAGSLIESVCKSERRKETVDNAYMEELFSTTQARYHFDQMSSVSPTGESRKDMPLPLASKLLIASIIIAWIGMGIVVAVRRYKAKKN
ncbi:MAG: carbohydrate ABC transporter substrate-binding protein [Lachnospiraceae bacterium]|nr:carbohydrate ABC transporter substrate-binding protein [Lachnospiraceae bacterium]